jgi:hypothetical protein
MQSRAKITGKLIARLIGVAFGLALALFLFASVASGHSYAPTHMARSSHAQSHVVFRSDRDRPFFRDDGFRFRHERFRQRIRIRVNVRVNVFVNVRVRHRERFFDCDNGCFNSCDNGCFNGCDNGCFNGCDGFDN